MTNRSSGEISAIQVVVDDLPSELQDIYELLQTVSGVTGWPLLRREVKAFSGGRSGARGLPAVSGWRS